MFFVFNMFCMSKDHGWCNISFIAYTFWCMKTFFCTIVENAPDKPTAAEMCWLQSRWALLFKQAQHQGTSSYKSTISLSTKQTLLNSTADNIKRCFKGIKALNEVDKVSDRTEEKSRPARKCIHQPSMLIHLVVWRHDTVGFTGIHSLRKG